MESGLDKEPPWLLPLYDHIAMLPIQSIRGLKRALNDSGRFRYRTPEIAVDNLVIGGGIVGLAIARQLSHTFPDEDTYLIERHPKLGQEITSRNSEVIHSGLYYPADSWKTRLCIRGRELMYERCEERRIPFRKTGKLVVAKREQLPYIQSLHQKSLQMRWPEEYLVGRVSDEPPLPTELISGDQAREMEPDLSKEIEGALWVPTTGIVDSHSFMQDMEYEFVDINYQEISHDSRVVRVDPYIRSKRPADVACDTPIETGWVVQVASSSTAWDSQPYTILAKTVVNAAGLSSTFILNSLLPQEKRIPMHFAKGSYAKYRGPGVGNVSHLIYPCPETGPNQHAFESLGTHLTLDLEGNIRFGPDLHWVSAPAYFSEDPEEDADFWMEHLTPDESHLAEMHKAVTSYLPGVTLDGLQPDYAGMRPKLVPPGGGFQDFVFRVDHPVPPQIAKASEFHPFVSLLGVESPGLTSSLAIAEHVVLNILRGSCTTI